MSEIKTLISYWILLSVQAFSFPVLQPINPQKGTCWQGCAMRDFFFTIYHIYLDTFKSHLKDPIIYYIGLLYYKPKYLGLYIISSHNVTQKEHWNRNKVETLAQILRFCPFPFTHCWLVCHKNEVMILYCCLNSRRLHNKL